MVIGAQRTGTNILREILNTNEQIAMLGEILSPSPAPAHWDNFCRGLPDRNPLPTSTGAAESLLDQYFEFVEYRIRNHWEGNKKSRSHAFGVDIKYNQLPLIAPANWDSASSPFLLSYLRSRSATLIHTTRNVIHCAISNLIASQRNLWHNYDGAVIDRSYHLDPGDCLAQARKVLRDRDAFLKAAHGCRVVSCRYESLIDDLAERRRSRTDSRRPGALTEHCAGVRSSFPVSR